MSRTRMVWAILPVIAIVLAGCPKKAPEPPPQEIEMDAETVEPPPAEEVAPPPPPPPDPVEVDPLESEDLREVNTAAQRAGFQPDVHFGYDQADLTEETREALSQNAQFLRSHPEFLVRIEGHCDERGTNEYNLALGDRRGSAAADYLTSAGVEANRLTVVSYGEERPVCNDSDEACWYRNRRAHMVIVGRR